MNEVRVHRRSEHCPSALRLDQWLAGELPPAEAANLEAHVATCERCRHTRAARLETRQLFPAEAPPFPVLVRSARRRRGRWLGGVALAAAAVLALVVGAPWRAEHSDSEGEPGTRTKGSGTSFGWVVRRGERTFVPGPDERLRSGDALRFTVSTRAPAYVAVFGLDESGQLSVYHPEGDRLAALGAGKDQPLPAAIALAAAGGDERLYAIFCREALPVSTLRQVIASAPEAPRLPEGCSYERQLLREALP
jgi:hypothetical protein